MSTLDITLYLVGEDEDDAQGNFPFDSYESAESYAQDQSPKGRIFSVTALIDFGTIGEVE